MTNRRSQATLREWMMAAPESAETGKPETNPDAGEDLLAPDPAKLGWMQDTAQGLASRIPTSVFALGELALATK
jgi:hypothetical protein